MSFHPLRLSCLFLCCLVVPVRAADPAELPALVGQLDAEDWKARTQAADRIAAMGEAARPALERLLKANPDGEAAKTARRLLAKMDDDRRFGPTPITLRLDQAPARQALAEIAGQAKVTILPAADALWSAGAEEPRVTVNADGKPFWAVLQQVCAQAGLRLESTKPDGPVQLAKVDPNEPSGPYVVAGPFLLKVKQIERTRAATFDGPRDQNSRPGVRISLFGWGEPKMPQAALSIDGIDAFETDAGPQVVEARSYWARGGQIPSQNEMSVTFHKYAPGARIARLGLAARFTVVGKKELLQIDNVLNAKNVEQKIGGFGFVLKDVHKIVDGRYAFEYELTPGDHTADDFKAFRQALDRERPKLLDAQGRPLQIQGGGGSSSPTKYTQTWNLTCDVGNGVTVGPPVRFEWEVPVETKILSFPIEFADMPLP